MNNKLLFWYFLFLLGVIPTIAYASEGGNTFEMSIVIGGTVSIGSLLALVIKILNALTKLEHRLTILEQKPDNKAVSELLAEKENYYSQLFVSKAEYYEMVTEQKNLKYMVDQLISELKSVKESISELARSVETVIDPEMKDLMKELVINLKKEKDK